jgi:hypothetical protein
MNLRWNNRFEAEFSQDFSGDLSAVKAAGFKPDMSTGAWVWWTSKAAPLQKLRENRPPSGLTITAEAKANYASISEMEAKNSKIKAEAKEYTKSVKKKRDVVQQIKHALVIPEKGYIDKEDLSPQPPQVNKYVPPPPPDEKCIICACPVYFYELLVPFAMCIWCEKITLDKSEEL